MNKRTVFFTIQRQLLRGKGFYGSYSPIAMRIMRTASAIVISPFMSTSARMRLFPFKQIYTQRMTGGKDRIRDLYNSVAVNISEDAGYGG